MYFFVAASYNETGSDKLFILKLPAFTLLENEFVETPEIAVFN